MILLWYTNQLFLQISEKLDFRECIISQLFDKYLAIEHPLKKQFKVNIDVNVFLVEIRLNCPSNFQIYKYIVIGQCPAWLKDR